MSTSSAGLIEHNNGFYGEDIFISMLMLERKRAERTRRPFMLTLIDVSKIAGDGKADKVLIELYNVLRAIIRETDIKGWYQHLSVIGIIFVDITGSDKDILCTKLYDKLRNVLSQEHLNKIDISCFIFPEEIIKDRNENHDTHRKFYPELSKKNASGRHSPFIKRVMDIIGSIIGIIIFSPAFLVSSILIKVTSNGPFIFKQERIGELGKKFNMLKLRTMHANCNLESHKSFICNFITNSNNIGVDSRRNNIDYKMTDDERVTPIGKLLRKSSLDEIPQFINVLKGEMSLVGPRPPIPYELEFYDLWHRRRIMEFKPGITGLWQVEGRSSTTFDEMVRMDIRYINEWSLLTDIKIMLKTPIVVLKAKGAY
jgi:lipopolysaccharide/colanic/teichoic acid biosynthesis glycosyltransferase